MNYLTPEQVLFIHSRLAAETGGSHGVRDQGLLESAVARLPPSMARNSIRTCSQRPPR
jgi:prophage maintenance system killer protein